MDAIRTGQSFTMSLNERHDRITNVLSEIRKEKPLGKCPLFKMSLTFRSFVWAQLIDTLYGSSPEPKLKECLQTDTVVAKKKPLLRTHSATSLKSSESIKIPLFNEDSQSIKTTTPGKTARKDAVRLNMLSTVSNAALTMRSKAKNLSQQADLSSRSHKIGAVPKYLTHRKAEWARIEEEKLKNLPDPDCPDGHVRMPESEKLETLTKLMKTQEELIEEFSRLPLSQDSLRIRQKKEDIEKQLTKVEEGIRVLSKPKVFVRFDC